MDNIALGVCMQGRCWGMERTVVRKFRGNDDPSQIEGPELPVHEVPWAETKKIQCYPARICNPLSIPHGTPLRPVTMPGRHERHYFNDGSVVLLVILPTLDPPP